MQGGVSPHSTEPGYAVVGCLVKTGYRAHRQAAGYVARGLAAPWRPVHHRLAVHHSQHRVVVVQQPRPRHMLQPQPAVGTLAGAAAPQE